MSEEREKGNRHHPNSLANLTPRYHGDGKGDFNFQDKEQAAAAGRKGGAGNRKFWEKRKNLRQTAKDLRDLKNYMDESNEEAIKGVEMLELLMIQAVEANELETAAEYANKLAEFQTPKLARTVVESVGNDKAAKTTDELIDQLRNLAKKGD